MTASNIVMPINVHGWEVIFAEHFDIDVPKGQVIGHPKYVNKITARSTGTRTSSPWKTGIYDNNQLEVKNSCLISHIETIDKIPRTTAILPRLPPSVKYPFGVSHGRFSVCLRIPGALPGYKIAWLLWPVSKLWPEDGEIDCPEQNLSSTDVVHGFMHRQDGISGFNQDSVKTEVSMCDNNWHVVTINWKPGDWRTPLCEFVVDGVSIGKWTEKVPNGPMYWILQTEPYLHTYTPPPATVKGIIEIDWIVAYKAT